MEAFTLWCHRMVAGSRWLYAELLSLWRLGAYHHTFSPSHSCAMACFRSLELALLQSAIFGSPFLHSPKPVSSVDCGNNVEAPFYAA